MKAVGYIKNLPITDPESLIDLDLPMPEPGPQDLLVEVRAVAVNPVDTKVRQGRPASDATPVVLGWDAVGQVRALGTEVSGFAVGDRVWYAGDLTRQGSNAQFQAVDHRIAARAPTSIGDGEAAALPLTAITAWELLHDRLQVQRDGARPVSLLVTGAAGGVGSILVQLARQHVHLTVIGTSSDPAGAGGDWLRQLGVHHVINHQQPLAPQVAALQAQGMAPVRHAVSLTHTPQHFKDLVELLEPQGRLAMIDDFGPADLDVMALKRKSLSLHWELMFTRSLYNTHDITEQGRLLAEVARLVDAGKIRSTLAEVLGPINAQSLKRAHALQESQRQRGKLVLQGF
ncbi:zinc-binding alcohol dehydrogenase family protein [Roseateles sp. YR242]|uniref:zinc-binding alcohol dehydrogenase family protein n=1 Tax=Roseateles sp. YR242 TaxID=1855305 RepID=UPI0008ACCE20|nr:zinc-binding alcohol dehydrogenase family protein [Roseateles sp. YR242]SEK96057.1 zinc-binding alcohol dehydrogenase family protein [Roseateles sp. YR242]